ncbi:MAG: hypothetical protein LBV13_00605 [Methanomassiliicoccaceae archaeon]|jgi:predicted RNA binding protein with dsRBD fold (UPF0201 family)|nr:hypothetical protein [Methanomassiliicoccaceae archaeon]
MQTISVSCQVFPSEDPEKVKLALLNIFPGAALEADERTIAAKPADMAHFGEQIRRQRILDTARSVMMKGRRGERSVFHLNKQAAYAGKISFVEEKTILGTIKVAIEAEDITAFIEMFAPQTVDGEEVRT